MFKKIYVEITNCCNLNCDFCIKNKREVRFMSLEEFDLILGKLKEATSYLYFHVLGEPLMHPKINDFIDMASKDFKVNLTTNGYRLRKIVNNKNVRQVNISLHSFDLRYGKSLAEYLSDIFLVSGKLHDEGTIINYRMWVNSPWKSLIIEELEKHYDVVIGDNDKVKFKNNVFYEVEESFDWPRIESNYYSDIGSCRALRDHIAILVDGSVVPCCLDSAGDIVLGNIYKQNLDDIIGSDLFKEMKQGFLDNKKICDLCKRCSFYEVRSGKGVDCNG